MPGYWHKMVLCWIHTLSKYLISNCVHSYSLSPRQTPFIKLELSREKQCGIALEQIKTVRTQGSCALLSGEYKVSTEPEFLLWVLDKGVFTLKPSEYRTLAPCTQAPNINVA